MEKPRDRVSNIERHRKGGRGHERPTNIFENDSWACLGFGYGSRKQEVARANRSLGDSGACYPSAR